jgi:OOP family OmpA-OmpF porin
VAISIVETPASEPKPDLIPDPKPEPKIEDPKPVNKPIPPTIPSANTLEKSLPKDVLFKPVDYEILKKSLPQLAKLGAFVARNPRLLLEIHGHTDVTGDPEIYLQLSKDRASEVATYLTAKGVNSSRITAKGFGASKPKYGQAKNQIYARNRRVALYIK